MKIIKKILPLFSVIALSVLAIRPILAAGFFPIHDNTQVARVFEMTKSLKMGLFPVRWVPDLGYGLGYPIFNFYAPLSYYFGSIFNLLGFDALAATKIMMGVGIIMAGIFMYFLVKELFGEIAAVVASVFYVYAPFHAVDIYVRGDVSEFWAYAFIPLVFYGLFKIYKTTSLRYVVIAALGYAGVITSHNLTAMMISPFVLFVLAVLTYASFKKKKINTIYKLFLAVFLAVAISCFYWLPALAEMKYTNVMSTIGGGANFLDHYVCISQLWTSSWGFGGSAPGCIDGVSFMIGKIHIMATILSIAGGLLLLVFKKEKIKSEKMVITIFSFLGFVFSVFLTLEISKFIWQAVPLMAFFQYPWRFLLMITFFSSISAGSLIWMAEKLPIKKIFPHHVLEIGIILIIVVLVFNAKFFVSQKILQNDSNFYTNEYTLKWTTSKISDEYLPLNTKKPKNANEALQNTQIFPFKETPIEKTANLISLAGIVIAILAIILPRKRIYHEK